MAKKSDPKAPEPPPSSHTAPEDNILRFTIPVDKDGKVLLDRMRESSRDQLRNIARDPRLGGAGGAGAPAPESAPIFTDAWAGSLFDMIGQVQVTLTARAYRCSLDDARVMLYTDQEKAILTGPLVRVLNKYGSQWMAQYADEFALLGPLAMITAGKLMALQTKLDTTHTPADVVNIEDGRKS